MGEEDDYADADLPEHAMGSPPELVEIVVYAVLGLLMMAVFTAACALIDRAL